MYWRKYNERFDSFIEKTDNDKDKMILDIGCGNCELIEYILKTREYKKVYGVDQDSIALKAKKEQFSKDEKINDERYELIESNFDDFLKDKNEPIFDAIWCCFVLSYIPNLKEFISKLINIVKPGGAIVLIEVDGLFSIHEPMDTEDCKKHFHKIDTQILPENGYDTFSGSKIFDSIDQTNTTNVIPFEYSDDMELSFNGKVTNPDVIESWNERFSRLKVFKRFYFSEKEIETMKTSFFNCLQNDNHKCTKSIKGCKILK